MLFFYLAVVSFNQLYKIIKMRTKLRGIIFFLSNCFVGFTSFLLVVLSGELISMSLGITKNISFGLLHIQIALLGAVLQGSIYFFKSLKNLLES